ncbi:MAG: hypothetical protein U9O89_05860 [Thermoproteota archaeon]|nr:hypothetical protein [Thermoproteota archaeon]
MAGRTAPSGKRMEKTGTAESKINAFKEGVWMWLRSLMMWQGFWLIS